MRSTNDPRHSARVLLVQKLFQEESNISNQFDLEQVRDIDEINSYSHSLYSQIYDYITIHKLDLESEIISHLADKNLRKVSTVDLVILKIAITESKFLQITPRKVAINEAIELSRDFGGMNNGAFVNGILDKILKEI